MDWGPYDISTLHALLAPRRVEVVDAFCVAPDIHADLPDGMVPDVEYHVGARLRYHLTDGGICHLDYERASAVHGPAECVQSFAGDSGGMLLHGWQDGGYRLLHDRDGEQVESDHSRPLADGPAPHERPLLHLLDAIDGADTRYGVFDADAVFNFACIRAIYGFAASDRPQTIDREDFL